MRGDAGDGGSEGGDAAGSCLCGASFFFFLKSLKNAMVSDGVWGLPKIPEGGAGLWRWMMIVRYVFAMHLRLVRGRSGASEVQRS